jgi:hypothetical protein
MLVIRCKELREEGISVARQGKYGSRRLDIRL